PSQHGLIIRRRIVDRDELGCDPRPLAESTERRVGSLTCDGALLREEFWEGVDPSVESAPFVRHFPLPGERCRVREAVVDLVVQAAAFGRDLLFRRFQGRELIAELIKAGSIHASCIGRYIHRCDLESWCEVLPSERALQWPRS